MLERFESGGRDRRIRVILTSKQRNAITRPIKSLQRRYWPDGVPSFRQLLDSVIDYYTTHTHTPHLEHNNMYVRFDI